jgi:hypothetical protein
VSSCRTDADFKRHSNMERTLQLQQQARRDCTFQPNINSPYMVRYKSSGRALPPEKNVNAMLRSTSRSGSRGRGTPTDGTARSTSGPAPAEHTTTAEGASSTAAEPSTPSRPDTGAAEPGQAGTQRQTAVCESVESSPGLRATSARRTAPGYISTRPQLVDPHGASLAATPQFSEFLDQKEYLGFGKVRGLKPTPYHSSMRRTSSDPRLIAPSAGAGKQSHPDFAADRSRPYRTVNLVSPSSAMYVQHNQFTVPPAASRYAPQYQPARPGRFSYEQQQSAATILRSPHASSASTGTTPRSARSPGKFFPSTPPTPRTPTTASAAEYKLSQDALHRKMHQELYYNTP